MSFKLLFVLDMGISTTEVHITLEALRHFIDLHGRVLLKLIEVDWSVLLVILFILFLLLIVGLLSPPSVFRGLWSRSPVILFDYYVVSNALCLHIRFNTLIRVPKLLL